MSATNERAAPDHRPLFRCNAALSIRGPAGALEAITTCVATEASGTAVVCHPHPLYGGTMDNKVVYTLARSFAELGLHTARFNFRGVGHFFQGRLNDLRAAVEATFRPFVPT